MIKFKTTTAITETTPRQKPTQDTTTMEISQWISMSDNMKQWPTSDVYPKC